MDLQPIEKMVPPPRLERGTPRSTIRAFRNETKGRLRHAAALALDQEGKITLACIKTGRWWPCADLADGYRKARELGLVDYTIGESK